MAKFKELHYTQLKKTYTKEDFIVNMNEEALPQIIGQEKAAKALDFGLKIKKKGYNVYLSGESGLGKTSYAKIAAEKFAENEPIPNDYCYVYNFQDENAPIAISLPAGMGKEFKSDMDDLIEILTIEIAKTFSDDDYEKEKEEIIKKYQYRRDELMKHISDIAKENDFGTKVTNSGMYFMPIVDGEPVSEDEYDKLSDDQKDKISEYSELIQDQAADTMRKIKDTEKETRVEIEDVEYKMALFTVSYHINILLEKYCDYDKILHYLLAVKEYILNNVEEFITEGDSEEESLQSMIPWISKKNEEDVFLKYKVNLFIDNSELKHAPVIVDFNPTYYNLIGELEYYNEYGNLATDFTKMKAGLLHKANGGYLILQAYDILTNPHSWDALRSFIKTEELKVENTREFYNSIVSLSTLTPEPILCNVKIILVGTDFYYDILNDYDDEFCEFFKVCATFDYEMNSSGDNLKNIALLIKNTAQRENLGEFELGAVAKMVEYSSRIAERQNKLTTKFSKILDLMNEASVYAKEANSETITSIHIKKAIFEMEQRNNMYEQKLSDMIEENFLMIDTTGNKVGQINGLAVLDTGVHVFGKPSKITATTYVGKSGIIDIEKESAMSGKIHDKGVLVIGGFLGHTYAQEFPLSLSCRICFEQNYNGIDGDSASSTELYAILSSLSGLPIRQEIAVTGSINQMGDIQPIGGVTYKIEGFFDLCFNRGLTGNQGVIIPYQNITDLSLKDEVIEAVKNGKFHIYPVKHIDEGIEILTDVAAGKRNGKGKFSEASVHGKVFGKLKEFRKSAL